MNKHLNQDISKTEKLLILDFDGVLVDSFEASMIAFKEIARRKNVMPLSENEIRNIATQGLFNRLKIKWWQIPYYISIARKIVKQNSSKIKIHVDVQKTLNEVRNRYTHIVIISSNKLETISNNINIMQESVTEIIGGVHFFKKAKNISRIMKKYNSNPTNTYYVGDETRDVDAANKVGINSIAVGYGYQSIELLKKHKPTYEAATKSDLQRLLVTL